MGRYSNGYSIRIPIDMVQFTKRDGEAWPMAFDWIEPNGDVRRIDIDKVLGRVPAAELISGVVGDRYECEINGQTEYLYYSIISPRKWFKLVEVSEEEYNQYYKLDSEEI